MGTQLVRRTLGTREQKLGVQVKEYTRQRFPQSWHRSKRWEAEGGVWGGSGGGELRRPRRNRRRAWVPCRRGSGSFTPQGRAEAADRQDVPLVPILVPPLPPHAPGLTHLSAHPPLHMHTQGRADRKDTSESVPKYREETPKRVSQSVCFLVVASIPSCGHLLLQVGDTGSGMSLGSDIRKGIVSSFNETRTTGVKATTAWSCPKT